MRKSEAIKQSGPSLSDKVSRVQVLVRSSIVEKENKNKERREKGKEDRDSESKNIVAQYPRKRKPTNQGSNFVISWTTPKAFKEGTPILLPKGSWGSFLSNRET